jgi:hypothetical protein
MHIQQSKTYFNLSTQTNPPQQLNKHTKTNNETNPQTNIDEKKQLKNEKKALPYG